MTHSPVLFPFFPKRRHHKVSQLFKWVFQSILEPNIIEEIWSEARDFEFCHRLLKFKLEVDIINNLQHTKTGLSYNNANYPLEYKMSTESDVMVI